MEKNVPDINTKISPLLRETFNLNTPFEGTFMKFPRNENYRRRIDGSMPRTSYILNQEGHPRDGSTFGLDEYNWKAFADNPNIDSPIYKALYKDKFNLFNPFKKRQFFDNQGNPFDLNTDLFKKEKGGSLPKAQLQLGKYGDDILKYSDDFLNIFRTTKPNVVSPLYTPLVTPSKYLQTQQLQPYQIRDLNEISNKSLPLNSLANTISESALGNFSRYNNPHNAANVDFKAPRGNNFGTSIWEDYAEFSPMLHSDVSQITDDFITGTPYIGLNNMNPRSLGNYTDEFNTASEILNTRADLITRIKTPAGRLRIKENYLGPGATENDVNKFIASVEQVPILQGNSNWYFRGPSGDRIKQGILPNVTMDPNIPSNYGRIVQRHEDEHLLQYVSNLMLNPKLFLNSRAQRGLDSSPIVNEAFLRFAPRKKIGPFSDVSIGNSHVGDLITWVPESSSMLNSGGLMNTFNKTRGYTPIQSWRGSDQEKLEAAQLHLQVVKDNLKTANELGKADIKEIMPGVTVENIANQDQVNAAQEAVDLLLTEKANSTAIGQDTKEIADYMRGTGGKEATAWTEPTAHIAELQQFMLDYKFLDDAYQNVTPDMIKKNIRAKYADKVNMGQGYEGYPLRILLGTKNTKGNNKIISSLLNKMLTGTALTGAAYSELEWNDQELEEKKFGGSLPKAQLQYADDAINLGLKLANPTQKSVNIVNKINPLTSLNFTNVTNRADLIRQYNLRNDMYRTVNMDHNVLGSNVLRENAQLHGFNPNNVDEFAAYMGTTPTGGFGRRSGYEEIMNQNKDILYTGNYPHVTNWRYSTGQPHNAWTVKSNIWQDDITKLSDQKLYDRISLLDKSWTHAPKEGIFNVGANLSDQSLLNATPHGSLINTQTIHVPELTQTNLLLGNKYQPVRKPISIFRGDDLNESLKLSGNKFETFKEGGSLPKAQWWNPEKAYKTLNLIKKSKDSKLLQPHVYIPKGYEHRGFTDHSEIHNKVKGVIPTNQKNLLSTILTNRNDISGSMINQMYPFGLYHGSPHLFDKPEIGNISELLKKQKKYTDKINTPGFYATADPEYASIYTTWLPDIGNSSSASSTKWRSAREKSFDQALDLGTNTQLYNFRIADDAKIKTIPSNNISSMDIKDRKKYIKEGYDAILGRGGMGNSELLILNEKKIENFNRMSSSEFSLEDWASGTKKNFHSDDNYAISQEGNVLGMIPNDIYNWAKTKDFNKYLTKYNLPRNVDYSKVLMEQPEPTGVKEIDNTVSRDNLNRYLKEGNITNLRSWGDDDYIFKRDGGSLLKAQRGAPDVKIPTSKVDPKAVELWEGGREFMQKWYTSPMAVKMMKNSDPENWEQLQAYRLENIREDLAKVIFYERSTDPDYSSYWAWAGGSHGPWNIGVYPRGLFAAPSAAHEFTHLSHNELASNDYTDDWIRTGLPASIHDGNPNAPNMVQTDPNFFKSYGKYSDWTNPYTNSNNPWNYKFGADDGYNMSDEQYLIPQSDMDLMHTNDLSFKDIRGQHPTLGNIVKEDSEYWGAPSEHIARLNAIRYKAYMTRDQHGWDPLTMPLTDELWQKVKKRIQTPKGSEAYDEDNVMIEQLMSIIGEDALKEELNTISDASDQIGDDIGDPRSIKFGGSLPKAQLQDEIIDANILVDDWSKKYHQSDNFRSLARGWDIPENVIDERIKSVMDFNPNTDITFNPNADAAGMTYNSGTSRSDGTFIPTMGPFMPEGKDMVNYNIEKGPPFHPMYETWENLAAHEVAGHVGMLDEDDFGKEMKKTLRKLGRQSVNMFLPSRKELDMSRKDYKEMKNHMKDNLEMRANLMQLRYKLAKEGLYDSTIGTAEGGDGTNPFTDEHLLEIYEESEGGWEPKEEWKRNEILQFIHPQDIKWMMNNVAQKDDPAMQDLTMAKMGKELGVYQKKGETEPNWLARRLYNSVTPIGYNLDQATKEMLYGSRQPFMWEGVETTFDDFGNHPRFQENALFEGQGDYIRNASEDLWGMYLGFDQKNNTVSKSKFKPTLGLDLDNDETYYSFNDVRDIWADIVKEDQGSLTKGKVPSILKDISKEEWQINDSGAGGFNLRNYQISKGEDEVRRLPYFAYYDEYDFDIPTGLGFDIKGESIVGNPFEIYGRIYYHPETGEMIPQKELKGWWVNENELKQGISYAESLNGELMINPQSTATGLYGQLFSEIGDMYDGTREEFALDIDAQNEIFRKRYEGEINGIPSIRQSGIDLYQEYKPQIENFPYSTTEVAALVNFLGRQGTREYLGYVLRDGNTLETIFPTKYGSGANQANKTPQQYVEKFNEGIVNKKMGGEIDNLTDRLIKKLEDGSKLTPAGTKHLQSLGMI